MSRADDAAREAQRQQRLLGVLFGADAGALNGGWLHGGAAQVQRGIAAYRANAGALAERALAAAFPTLQQLLGTAAFAALARHFWHAHAPVAGDIGVWGAGLPAFIADAQSLAAEPYLADVARLEWAVHLAQRAADCRPPQGLELLAEGDPAALWLHLAPGTALIASAHPIASLWHAHRSAAADRFDAVRRAFADGRGETALVSRHGWQVTVAATGAEHARWTAALLAGRSLAQALDDAGSAFDFEAWLIDSLQTQGLAAASTSPSMESP